MSYRILASLPNSDIADEAADEEVYLSIQPGPMMSLDVEPDVIVDLSQPLGSKSRSQQKRQLKKEQKAARLERIQASKDRWQKGRPDEMEQPYVDRFEARLAEWFRPGYEKNIRPTRDGFEEEKDAPTPQEIVDYVRSLAKTYGFLISGGFVLKSMGLPMQNYSKPSIDIDLIVPYETPKKHPEFYAVMAALFDCDRKPDGKYRREVYMGKLKKDGTPNRFMKEKIYSTTKHKRTRNGVEEEMDIVRPMAGYSPEAKIRAFDISVCMNWYDHTGRIWSLDKLAITDPKNHTGWVTPREARVLGRLALKGRAYSHPDE